ncbi:PLP-dependent transferase [Trametes versicolor FP-101664 SS1]|uniref:PLP-dependent transferase n=1 Tax=Trametes versicolor (strain FP-101664) TaxID=717944 RepID=UPI0004623760|nr:PLP-dependent transferase [Trametes versicolor FP-101664 SS1]EIW53854.1 PLP-dependent transferase [Trametes versicolor FP-101664 SS1]
MPIPQLVPSKGESYDPAERPPPFGYALKKYIPLDQDYVNLNPGSWGTVPLPVLFAATRLGYEIERNPDKMYRQLFHPLIVKARESIANLVGADRDEIVFAPNATLALNTVLRNFEWRQGDLIVGATTLYGGVANTIRYLADRSEHPHPELCLIEYTFPLTHAEIIALFRSKLREFKAQHTASGTRFTDRKNKIVVVLDAITAAPAALMPWKEMVRICREEGAWAVVDAAHSIGQEPDINLSAAKPDFWVTDCHKWLYAKRACAVLYVPMRNQHIIKSSIPTSHEYVPAGSAAAREKGTNFVMQHGWTGTPDHTAYASVPDALAFREWLGGEKAINNYCHQLALDGGERLARALGTRVLDQTGELTLNMTNVRLPLPIEKIRGEIYTPETIARINVYMRDKLLDEWGTYVVHFFHAGAWWCRCSPQVFNELADFDYLGNALLAVCEEIAEVFNLTK